MMPAKTILNNNKAKETPLSEYLVLKTFFIQLNLRFKNEVSKVKLTIKC
jgi:hypothetical protein